MSVLYITNKIKAFLLTFTQNTRQSVQLHGRNDNGNKRNRNLLNTYS